MAVIIVCNDGMRFGRDLEPQAGAVGCVVGHDYVIAKATGEIDGETKLPIFTERHRVALKDDNV